MLRSTCPSVGQIGRKTLEVAMLVALRHARALHHLLRALFAPAFARHGHLPRGPSLAWRQPPPRSLAQRAVFSSHVLPSTLSPSYVPAMLATIRPTAEICGETKRAGFSHASKTKQKS